MAQAGPRLRRGDHPRLWPSLEVREGERDGGVSRQRPGNTGQEGLFEEVTAGPRRRGREQPLAQLARRRAPQRLQRHVRVAQLAGGEPEEWERAARLELHFHARRLACGVDDGGL